MLGGKSRAYWRPLLTTSSSLLMKWWVLVEVVALTAARVWSKFACRLSSHQFFTASNQCGPRDFLNLMGLLAGIPTFALVAMRQSRPLHLLGVSAWAVYMCCLFRNEISSNFSVWRNVLLCTLYHYIFSGAAYFR